MATIVPNQVFLDGTNRYEPGNEYEVDDDLATYFRKCGWLVDSEGVVPADVDLDVHSAEHGHEGEGL